MGEKNINFNNFKENSRSEKILVSMYDMAKGTKENLRFEDIVVGVFKRFPKDFHLKGYKEFPDSGDIIHKPLYDFRKKGLVTADSKVFSLTERGLYYVKTLLKESKESGNKFDSERFPRFLENEIKRVKSSEGFKLFSDSKTSKLTDNDFYNYLGVTARTSKNDFLGRLSTMKKVVQELKDRDNISKIELEIIDYHKFLMDRFSEILTYFKSK